MPGKPKTADRIAPGWGEAREGAGRKPESLSLREVQAMKQKARQWAEETGNDINDFLW
jgi:hypothetical protein